MILKKDRITFSEESIMDDYGRVFFHEGNVFRAIAMHQKDNCKLFLQSELYRELLEKEYIVKSWQVDIHLNGFAMVLEHEFINKSQPHNWSFNMYKDAILLILKINQICNKYGYELKDAHPYNIFFKKNKPIFIDLGSIAKIKDKDSWSGYHEFLNYCYLQFLVWIKGDYFLLRKLLEDGNFAHSRTIPMNNIFDSSFINLVRKDLVNFNLYLRNSILYTSSSRNSLIHLFCRVGNRIYNGFSLVKRPIFEYKKDFKNIEFVQTKIVNGNKPQVNTAWQDYHSVYKNGSLSTLRFERIIELVKKNTKNIKSSIDLAGNQGIFSHLLSEKMNLNRIILTDYDENAIDEAYLYFKKTESKIEPYLFNFMRPLKENEIQILKADVAFALAITHHLILSQGYLLPAILNKIEQFSNKYVVVEFMPRGLSADKELPSTLTWYNLDWFRTEFQEKFILLVEEQLEVNRIVFIGKKRHINSARSSE